MTGVLPPPPAGWALVTNDDGIDAPGLHALAGAAVAAGLPVVVAAPAGQASGAGTSVLATRVDGMVAMEAHELPELPGVAAYGVAAQPAFIAFAALNGWFETPPAIVLSGINYGANLGRAVLHSGTVGAALTASRFGARSLAVSLDCDHLPTGARERWDTAAGLLPAVLDVLASAPAGTTLSLNVPNLPFDALGEPRAAPLCERGRWRAEVRPGTGGLLVRGVRRSGTLEPGTDAALLSAGHPTLTALTPIGESPEVPLATLLSGALRRPA